MTRDVLAAEAPVEGQRPSPRSSATIVSISGPWMCSGGSIRKRSVPPAVVSSMGLNAKVLNRTMPLRPVMVTESSAAWGGATKHHVPVPATPERKRNRRP